MAFPGSKGSNMTVTPDTLVADLAVANPATIRVFQRHRIDFCCGGRIPLSEACADRNIAAEELIGELELSMRTSEPTEDVARLPLSEIVAHIQRRFHRPLMKELPRLRAMLDKVVSRHGDRLPDVLFPLRETFLAFELELVAHIRKEDDVLFPAIVALEAGEGRAHGADWTWIDQPIDAMELEHAAAGDALARMAELTGTYSPPADACPTFLGLYHGLAELEREMHVHVHLENHALFPRANALARAQARAKPA
jgi:regulator of cell morphogenesis and NO signaling